MGYAAGGGAAARAAAIAQAIKASGAIVSVEPDEFVKIIAKADRPLVVMAQGGVFKKHHEYLSAYKGLIFHTRSRSLLMLPGGVELVAAKQIWVPS